MFSLFVQHHGTLDTPLKSTGEAFSKMKFRCGFSSHEFNIMSKISFYTNVHRVKIRFTDGKIMRMHKFSMNVVRVFTFLFVAATFAARRSHFERNDSEERCRSVTDDVVLHDIRVHKQQI